MWGFTFAINIVVILIKTRRLFYKVKLPFIHFKQKRHAKCIRFRIQLQLRWWSISWSSFKTIYYDIGGKIKKVKKQIISTNQRPSQKYGGFLFGILNIISYLCKKKLI